MYQHILIATDGSEVARKGLDHGLRLAGALGARATIAIAAESLMAYVGGDGGLSASAYLEYTAAQKMAAERVLAEAAEAAARAGVAADTLFLENALPAEAIITAAGDLGCGLIVMSSHRPAMRTYFLGSNAGHVVRYAKCSVLVVRH